ncbi:hypothetical protein ESA94_16740 [Lacibacter luteus]|uniref:DUF3316 domain-containing protein n=1 Tax=Lacibacter luteus TaxID=2508719 RepID=A0A4Q1CEJ9_9BACT|nr:hypothetical protein [Lacibacter luteus]RXK58294.1 hypothetical protein ESA94_16740 [Lacibacter luteus]
MRYLLNCLLLLLVTKAQTQELYIFSNPASNIPAKALVAKVGTKTMRSYHNNEREFRFMPELQLGLTKNWMLTGNASFSNMFFQSKQQFESARLYTKYRFYSNDEVHKHFRAAVYAAGAWSNNPLVYQELNLEGDNSGLQIGVVATQLVNKFAASAGVAYVRQLERKDKLFLGYPFSNNALQYNLSMGYLLFPLKYENYKQTNLNLYCEVLAQQNTDVKVGFIDIAPAVQLIFNSSTRFNVGARYQLTGNAHRMADRSMFISLEHYFLNALK